MRNIKTVFISIVLTLGGCALSPQTITIAPAINVGNAPGGQTGVKSVTIKVNDVRTDTVIGTRGGIYRETALLTAHPGMVTTLQAALSNSFRELGYTVVDSGAIVLTVDVAELKYTAGGENTVTSIETSATVNANCRNGNLVMNNSYRVTDKQDVLKAPSGARNQELINNTLASALQRMVSDPKLLDCLNR
jgi:uncharacterized lipoprotein